MPENLKYMKHASGKLKLISILLTLPTMVLAYCGHFLSNYTNNRDQYRDEFIKDEVRSLWREWLFLSVTGITMVASTANFIGHLYSQKLYLNRKTAYIDFFYQYAAGLCMAVSGVLYVISAVKLYEINCTRGNDCQQFEVKLGAGGMALISGFVFATLGSVVLTNREEVQRGIQ